MNENILEVKNLKKYFEMKSSFFSSQVKYLKAVDGITFSMEKGKTLGIVGESGCGKTTLGRTILGLYRKTDGKIIFEDKDIDCINNTKELKRDIQMIFQDPYASLNPRMTVYDILEEPFRAHKIKNNSERKEIIYEFLNKVGLNESHTYRYPHEFSGGQRQRIGIARALMLKPKLLICDEPISALDVSIQSQIINMLGDFQQELNLSYLFIAHDLSMVKYISDDVGVMYLGNLVELGNKKEIFENRLHPYTEALLSSAPVANPRAAANKKNIALEGEIPSLMNPPSGCKFRTRCRHVMDICKTQCPELKEVSHNYFVSCHLY